MLTVSAAAALALGGGVASGSTSGSAHTYSTPPTLPLRTAFLDNVFETAQQGTAFSMARSAGATYVRLSANWQAIAPSQPATGFVADDPASLGYSWGALDTTVAAAEAAGLTPILDIATPPTWAFVSSLGGVAGAPRTDALTQFATALATHYDGTHGAPAVHVFQVWNEPNKSVNLDPVSASTYREMVNAVADAAHAVDPTNLVVAGGLDPFGHPKSKKQKWYSVAPLAFMRSLLCLSKGAHPHATCHDPVRFDVWSHHPYTFGGPFGHAKHPDDVELGDLPKMRALLQAAGHLHTLASAQPVQFWVTEFGWDTSPPRPHAVPLKLAGRWTAESLHQMWISGVSLVTWFLIEDYPSPSKFQSGLYYHSPSLASARPKPLLTAFRFPFVAYRDKKTVTVWGRNATSTDALVTVQLARGAHGPWRTVARIHANASGVFRADLRLKAPTKDWLRATAPGSGTSLAFSLTRPKDPRIDPWGS